MLFSADYFMAGISGWVFMAIGASVSLFSRYVQKRGGEGLGLFFWAGIAMIGIGIFKIVVGFILREKKSEEEKEKERLQGKQFKFGFNKDLEGVNEKLVKEKQQAMDAISQTGIVVCPNCGTKHYSNSNFCHMCGRKLK